MFSFVEWFKSLFTSPTPIEYYVFRGSCICEYVWILPFELKNLTPDDRIISVRYDNGAVEAYEEESQSHYDPQPGYIPTSFGYMYTKGSE